MVLEAHEGRYTTSQLSWVSKDSCWAKEKSCRRSIESHLESSGLPKPVQASQEATARSGRVVVKMHFLLLDRYEQMDPEGWRHSVTLDHLFYGIVLRGR